MRKMGAMCAELLTRQDWVVLDTETTSLGEAAEACQIGIVSWSGEVLLDTLVKPTRPISSNATAVHGITDDMVKDAPTMADLIPKITELLAGKIVVIYNAPFDTRILRQSSQAGKSTLAERQESWRWMSGFSFVDVMEPYAEYWGEWNNYHHNYKWQSLSRACAQQGIVVENAHAAVGDCQMTLALIKEIGAAQESGED